MALIVETGSGVAGANSFVDLAYAATYFSDRNIAAWGDDDDLQTAALIRAAQYLNGLRWQGSRVNFRSLLCWPRFGVPVPDFQPLTDTYGMGTTWGMYWPSNEIPEPVKMAQCEAALRYLQGTDMLPDLDRGGLVLHQKVDVIEKTFASFAPGGTTFQSVLALLRPFLKSSASVEMVRA